MAYVDSESPTADGDGLRIVAATFLEGHRYVYDKRTRAVGYGTRATPTSGGRVRHKIMSYR